MPSASRFKIIYLASAATLFWGCNNTPTQDSLSKPPEQSVLSESSSQVENPQVPENVHAAEASPSPVSSPSESPSASPSESPSASSSQLSSPSPTLETTQVSEATVPQENGNALFGYVNNSQGHINSVDEYRDIFNSYAKNEYKYSDSQVSDLLFYPSPKLMNLWTNSAVSKDPLSSLAESMKKILPSELHQASKATPWNLQRTSELEASFASSGPITLILFNGVFSENGTIPAWNDLWLEKENSSYAKTFIKKYEKCSDKSLKTDDVYSVVNEGSEPHKLTELVKTASFDDASGHPLIKIIFFNSMFGSLESLGDAQNNAEVFMGRLNKVFKIIDEVPSNIYLLGFSRGTPIALNFLLTARSQADKYPWASKIGGIVSYTGTTFGSYMADDAFPSSPNPPGKKSFLEKIAIELEELSDGLTPLNENDSAKTKAIKIAANNAKWIAVAEGFAKAGLSLNPMEMSDPRIKKEKLETKAPDLGTLLLTGNNYAFKLLEANKPIKEYSANIRRFKVLMQGIINGMEGLSLKKRTEWWKTHKLPGDVKLFSLATTMYDTTLPDAEPSPFLFLSHVANHRTVDYGTMRKNYYKMNDWSGGIALNDGLMSMDRSMFWPQVISYFNPEFPSKNTLFLGIHSVNHFGFANPVSTPSADGSLDPFPRVTILRSIGTYISHLLAREKSPK